MTAALLILGLLFVAAAAWWWPWLDRFADDLEHDDVADIVWYDAPIGRAVHDDIYGGGKR